MSQPRFPGDHDWTRDPFVVLDTETTGLDPRKHHVLELSMVRAEGLREVAHLSLLLNPGEEALKRFAGSGAARVNKIDPEHLRGAPTFRDEAREILDFLDGLPVMAYNAPFDAAFLRVELTRAGLPFVPVHLLAGKQLDPNVWVRDVDRYVRKRSPADRRHSLASAAERRGLTPEGDLHRALTDARLTLTLARCLRIERNIMGWTARLLHRQEGRRAAQDVERREFRERCRRDRQPDPDPGSGDGFDRDL
jgi:DNA polymerase III subunit epsilon